MVFFQNNHVPVLVYDWLKKHSWFRQFFSVKGDLGAGSMAITVLYAALIYMVYI
jgi:hypothetical protein